LTEEKNAKTVTGPSGLMRNGAGESIASEPAMNDLIHPLDKPLASFLTFLSETDPSCSRMTCATENDDSL